MTQFSIRWILSLNRLSQKSGQVLDGLSAPQPSRGEVAHVNGVALDYPALLACAWGSPVDAFGPPFLRFAAGRLPRLPGPPYHFVTRIARIDGEVGVEREGSTVVTEFDVDPSAWFFRNSGAETMPLAALMEIGLQPCGWLACFSGIPLRSAEELYFRNLDGSAKVRTAVPAARGCIRTTAKLTNVSRSAGITLTSFAVRCEWDREAVLEMQTTFGFFRRDDLARQAGLPSRSTPQPGALEETRIDLTSQPGRYFRGPLPMPSGDLLMLDRVTGIEEPSSHSGWVRAEKDVRPGEWFFKAHFYQDPVQPGSLGLESLVQALQFYAIHYRLDAGIPQPVFIMDSPLGWK
jgi:3-hydroxymyristoyl/3-hydroxydecanoyl-(acyl carrier protein) dehydratase